MHRLLVMEKSFLKNGGKICSLGDLDYPSYFEQLNEPPQRFYYFGKLPCAKQARLAIVGSREVDHFAKRWLQNHLSVFLQMFSGATVSGGARGIDILVHQLSVRHRVPTLMILPSGLFNPYPRIRQNDFKRIIESGGCIMSEFSLDAQVRKHHFYQRNRLIAAASQVLLVVQAGLPSGTLLSAKWAMDLAKIVAVLPSFPGDPVYAGNLSLLFDGAQPIRDHKDLNSLLEMVH